MSHSTTADMISDVHDIENALYNSFSDLESVIGRLMGSHGRAESALATLNDATFSTFTREIYARFPKTARQFVGSLSSFLLSSLATALTDVSQQGKLGKSRDSNECWKAVVLARPALAEIASLSDNSRWSQADIRVKPFVDLGVDPPSNPQELFALETQILRDQEGILKHIFSLLRGPARDDIIARWHALAEMETVVDSARPESSGSDETATPEAQPESQTPINAHPALDVLPLKAAFYEDHVKGFGEWEVFITDNANSDFRKLRKKSPELLRVVMKKIRDLSRGHFSPDNQILISDTENSVPIFKAKMTGVSRLVYQVDCVKDLVSDSEFQALRIFGVYNHAELKHKGNFWVELSRDLGRKGKEYRDRCRARSQPTRTARDVFSPVKFWLQSEEANKGEDEPLPLASLKDVDYSEVLSMHRSVTLSKGLFNSFLVDRDIRFMFRPSTKEIEIIEHPHSCYVIGRSGTGKTLSMMYKIVSRERGWASISAELPKPRQLFVTRSRMLAAEVQRTVDHLLESFKLADLTQQELLDIWRRQVDPMDEIRPLPRKWSDLDDEHFPMCISFDQLRDMLEADFAACDPSMATTIGELGEDIDFEEHAASFVSWKRFATAYWDHLPQHLTRGLDPVSVFGEIMGVLKGSEGTIDTPHGNLDREAYLGLSPRHSTFVSIRNQIYDILQRYNLLKRRRHEYDDADRTHRLLRLINAHTLPGRPVNFLFNDEAQDNLIIDMLLLRKLCDNPNGLFWAGDTAQTIAIGSSFKFSELTAMMYRVEKRTYDKSQSLIPPRTFHLPVNYRSHAGITDCAQVVVDIVTALWPASIDRLSSDRGWREGPKPLFVRGSDIYSLFSRQDKMGARERLDKLGSEQCIIVRDDASRKRLFKALFSQGVQVGLVMTVYESKGLEFDDVFIWHFFDSTDPSEREWSVICDLFLGRLTRSLHRSVDEYRHVCRELKSLYVAITRARNRLFIIEESSKGDPMLAVWQKLGLVDVNEDNQPISLSMKTPEPEEWAKRGRSLMDKQNYEQAKYCFEQAGFRREGDIAQAYLDQEAAVTVEQFRKAAQSFKSCADLCFGVAEHEQLLIASAICYSRAGAFAESAALYYTARAYTRCAQQYIKASMMDEARQVILRHRNEINAYVLRKVCVHFLDSGEQEKAAELFPDLDTFSEFIRSHNLIGHLATYLESLGLLEKAAEVRLELNQVDKAIALFLRDESHGSVARGTNRLLDELWRLRTMGQPENKYSNVPDVLIDLVSYRKSLTGLRYRDYERDNNETHMFSSIISRQAADLMQTGVKLFSVGNQTNAALLSLDYAFAFLLEDASLEPSVLVDSPEFFPAFCTYATLLKSHHRDAHLCRLLGIRRSPTNTLGSYSLLPGTLLCQASREMKDLDCQAIPGEGGLVITATSLSRVIRETLDGRLHARVSLVNNVCKRLAILQPCISYCLSGLCLGLENSTCRWTHQAGSHSLNVSGLHLRIRVLCQNIIAYGTLDANDDAIWRERTYWMYALSSSLHIPFFSLGTPSMFHRSLVPEFSDAARVIRSWIIDILYFAFTPASTHWISTGALRIDLIPCAALLGYILDKLEDHPRSPQSRVVPIPLELWYGKLYSQHLQQLGDYASRNEPSHFQMPGALLYLQFLLEGGGGSFGREAVISYITEGLSTAIVLANRGRKDKPLHNVILVRRWVINLADLWSSAKPPTHHHNEHVQKFIKLFPALLGSLCAVPDGASIRRVLRPLSNDILSYVSSVVKALTLVGHWLKHTEEERLEMVGYVTNIPVHYRPPHLRRLSAGSRWTHLREAIWWQSPPALPRMDQLVHIQNSSLADTDPMRTPGFVVRVAYDRLGNLESQLTVPQPTRQAAPFPATWFLPRRHPLDGEKVVVPSHIAPCLLGHLWPQEV